MECQLADITVYYEEYGEGRPMVIVHGFTPDHRLMSGCIEPSLREREGWKRIYLDLPGMGKTPAADWITSTDDMLDVVLRFIDQVIPGQRFVIVGESYGGYLARGVLHWRGDMVDGAFLLCPAIIAEYERRDVPPQTTLVYDPELFNRLSPAEGEEFATMAVVQSEHNWQRFRDEIMSGLVMADKVFLQRLQHGGRYSFSFDVEQQPFEAPTLILTGRQDASVGYRDAWKLIESYPRATFAVLDRAGHNLQIEQEALFSVMLSEWLDRVEEYHLSS